MRNVSNRLWCLDLGSQLEVLFGEMCSLARGSTTLGIGFECSQPHLTSSSLDFHLMFSGETMISKPSALVTMTAA